VEFACVVCWRRGKLAQERDERKKAARLLAGSIGAHSAHSLEDDDTDIDDLVCEVTSCLPDHMQIRRVAGQWME